MFYLCCHYFKTIIFAVDFHCRYYRIYQEDFVIVAAKAVKFRNAVIPGKNVSSINISEGFEIHIFVPFQNEKKEEWKIVEVICMLISEAAHSASIILCFIGEIDTGLLLTHLTITLNSL